MLGHRGRVQTTGFSGARPWSKGKGIIKREAGYDVERDEQREYMRVETETKFSRLSGAGSDAGLDGEDPVGEGVVVSLT